MTRQRNLPLGEWPPADRGAWQAATSAGPSLLDQRGAAAHLSECARDDYERRYGYFLDWAQRHGRLVVSGPPAGTVTRAAVGAYVTEMAGPLSSVTLAQSIRKIARMAECLAPGDNWIWLRNLSARLAYRMHPADQQARVVESHLLFDLGMDLMAEAEASLAIPRRSKHRIARRPPRLALGPSFTMAQTYRDGLMIALLAACALRRGNFTELEVGATLVRRPGGWSIEIPGRQVKNRRPIAMPILEELADHLDRYVACFRPVFHGADSNSCMWMSRNGCPLSQSAVFHAITTWTGKRLGRAVSPHLFRDAVVTTLALHYGAHIGAGTAMLGHVDPEITRKHYNQARMIDAVRQFQSAILVYGQNSCPEA